MTKRETIRISLLFFLSIVTLGTDQASSQGPPINTETALLAGFSNAFRASSQIIEQSGRLPGGMSGDLSVRAVSLIFPYAITQGRLVIGGAIPYLDKDLDIKGPGGTTHFSEGGLGDLHLFAEYAFFVKDEREKTTRAILIGGIDLPTGSHGNPDLPQGLWNGSGAVNYSIGAAFSYIPAKWGLYTDLIYRITTEGSGFEFGDTLRYDLAVGYRLWPGIYETYPSPQINIFLEFNGLWEQKNRDFRSDGNKIHDSGGNRIFLSPGIQFIPGRAFLIEASVQIPLVENLNGDQLKTDFQANFGLRWLLF